MLAPPLNNQMPICLLLDGLYANGPTFSLCRTRRWKYFIILKDKDLPSVNQEFETLVSLLNENRCHQLSGQYNEIERRFSWVDNITYRDSFGCEHSLAVLQCLETKPHPGRGIVTSKFKWITNFQLHQDNIAILANKGGRLRWKIENEGFNFQKTGDSSWNTHTPRT